MQVLTFTPRSQLVIKPSLRTSLPCTFAARPTKHYTLRASSAAGSAPIPEEEPSTSAATSPTDVSDTDSSSGFQKLAAWWKEKQAKSADLRKRLVSLGPAAVLAYGKNNTKVKMKQRKLSLLSAVSQEEGRSEHRQSLKASIYLSVTKIHLVLYSLQVFSTVSATQLHFQSLSSPMKLKLASTRPKTSLI